MNTYRNTNIYWAALVIIMLALALNLSGLAAKSFWGDEILTAVTAGQSSAQIINLTANDIHPPLYYLAAGFFTRLTIPLGTTHLPNPTTDWLWRFPSVIFAVLTVAATHRLARYFQTYLSPRTVLPVASLAALLLALAPVAIKYAQEARMHALFMFLSALSTLLLFRALAKPQKWLRWLVFALITAANIYTMYFGFLILTAQGGLVLCLLIANRKKQLIFRSPQLIGFSAAAVLTFLLYIPWWPVLFNILRQRAAVGAIEGGVGNPSTFIRGVVQALGPLPEPVAWIFLLLFIIGLIFLIKHHGWPLAVFAALWLLLPTLLPIILGDPRALQFRYAFILPVYLIVVACGAVGLSMFTKPAQRFGVFMFLGWLLATLSFIAIQDIYNQTKPNWRGAGAYLNQHAAPADMIILGPLWDEGRFIDYYYHGQAPLLTPAAMVTNIERRAEAMRTYGGRIWAVNRFAPQESMALGNVDFTGVVVSEPKLVIYEPALLTEAAIDLAAQAVDAAYPWAAESDAQGILDPDPRTAQAAALRTLGDTLVAASRPNEAIAHYQTAVDIFPGWVSGYLVLAETQETVGNLPAAAQAYREAVNYNLKWHGPQANEAAALVEAGQWESAIALYHQLIEN